MSAHVFIRNLLMTVVLLPVITVVQRILLGVVTDSSPRQAIVGANFYFEGTALGSMTNLKAKYNIAANPE